MAAPTVPNNVMDLSHGPGQPMGMDSFDQDLGFDESLLLYASSDSSSLVPLSFAAPYDFDPFASTFEDPFSYSTRPFEPIPSQDLANDEASPQELDNKLLGFSEPIIHATLVDEAGKFVEMNMSAELYGMFFVAEDVFGGETTGRPFELTCYRRNLWQCSGQVTLTRLFSHIIDEQGRQMPIVELSASITAVESIEGKATEIISIPWKNANPQVAEETRVASSPPSLALDLSSGQEIDETHVSLPVSWKRLQFKHATANNGRRKGLQQHYVVQINLLGKTKSGDTVKIAEIQSGPVIVRGRSPRNFDSRRDVPLIGDKKLAADRKNLGSSDGSGGPNIKTERERERENSQPHAHRYHSASSADMVRASPPHVDSGAGTVDRTQCTGDWPTSQPVPQPTNHPSPHPAKRLAASAAFPPRPPIPAWSPDSIPPPSKLGQVPRTSSLKQNAAVPISLSLSEDEKSSSRSSAELQSPQPSKVHTTNGLNASSNSPAEDADPLYEYFPLSVDDWMPPVDAVYRPHIVHHTIVPAEFKAQAGRSSRSKRYFAAD
ncbi:Protein pacG [Escovopsis weberi]|uniref:Protein pacG n=1 Tax=Escovopsis weberi TaxID=150374 RepID=A0A0M9VS82_ESCWE|nr:Protein pacG [Escovopsis weberi]